LESNIKNYEGMDLNKTRPVLVISTNHNLMDRALVVEISTQKVNKNSIE
jgi:mRNA-degrading endonuclease toxin of MazEF toxin-antitoxin module